VLQEIVTMTATPTMTLQRVYFAADTARQLFIITVAECRQFGRRRLHVDPASRLYEAYETQINRRHCCCCCCLDADLAYSRATLL